MTAYQNSKNLRGPWALKAVADEKLQTKNSTVLTRGCQSDNTEPQPFPKLPHICKFEAPSFRND